jgi:hypothetical protein
MALNRLKTVGTASWNKPTTRADQGRNPTAIKADQRKQKYAYKPVEWICAFGR